MAKAKKPAPKKPIAKRGRKSDSEETEPLSNFQTPATGRKDPSMNGTKKKLSTLTIEKVKLVGSDFLEVNYSRIESDATTSNDKYENRMRPVHNECRNAFKALAIHLGLLCDYLSTQQIKDIEKYNADLVTKFLVTGVSLSGADDDKAVILTGRKITKSGKHVILNSPLTRFFEKEATAYRYIDDLTEKIEVVIKEAELYMGGKRGEDPQGSLQFPNEEAGKGEIEEVEEETEA